MFVYSLLSAAAAAATGTAAAAAATVPVRIMPLGDSITVFDCRLNAYTSADDRPIFTALNATRASGSLYPQGTYFIVAPGGYRGYLGSMLGDPARLPEGAQALPSWSYVGSQFLCGAHEGHAGETIAWLSNITTDAMARAQPDVVLFQAGTNDFFWPPPRGSRSVSAVVSRLRVLLNKAFAAVPGTTFLMSTVTPINATRCGTYHTARWHPGDCPADMPSNILEYNKMLPGVVEEYRQAGHDIHLHDVGAEAGFTAEDYFIWGIHFNATGFEKMAARWHKALMATAPMRESMGLTRD